MVSVLGEMGKVVHNGILNLDNPHRNDQPWKPFSISKLRQKNKLEWKTDIFNDNRSNLNTSNKPLHALTVNLRMKNTDLLSIIGGALVSDTKLVSMMSNGT